MLMGKLLLGCGRKRVRADASGKHNVSGDIDRFWLPHKSEGVTRQMDCRRHGPNRSRATSQI
jgi:hypothetical protein